MTPKEYGQIIGHSEGYIRKFIMKGEDADILRVRIPMSSIIEDIYDVKAKKEGD